MLMEQADLLDQRFTQADVLAVTKLRPELLQTWVNRGVLKLGEQNPGSGRRRLYSALDIVKLALMRRIADLGLELDIGRDLAGEAERTLLEGRAVEWDLYLTIRKDEATHKDVQFTVVASAGYSLLALKYNAGVGDARHMLVSQFTEPLESVFRRRRKRVGADEQPMDPRRREALAKAGVHAEPALIFPFGEIVNGALLQVQALREGHLPSVIEAMLEIERLPPADDADED
jgi:DNA-binding transcriptional MerR regulator